VKRTRFRDRFATMIFAQWSIYECYSNRDKSLTRTLFVNSIVGLLGPIMVADIRWPSLIQRTSTKSSRKGLRARQRARLGTPRALTARSRAAPDCASKTK
jgi:hypothetical protein